MHAGPELLKEWMDRRGYTQAKTAELFQMHESFLSMMVNRKRLPRLDKAIQIERLTGIPVEAWSSSEVDELQSVVSGDTRKRRINKR